MTYYFVYLETQGYRDVELVNPVGVFDDEGMIRLREEVRYEIEGYYYTIIELNKVYTYMNDSGDLYELKNFMA